MADAIKPVTQWLQEALSGRIPLTDCPPAVQSWARLSIYEGALEVLKMEWVEDRRRALGKIPPLIRPYIEAEVKRLWPLRDELAPPR